MKSEDFFNWLDTIIDQGDADWFLVGRDEDGRVVIAFDNIEENEEIEG